MPNRRGLAGQSNEEHRQGASCEKAMAHLGSFQQHELTSLVFHIGRNCYVEIRIYFFHDRRLLYIPQALGTGVCGCTDAN